MTSKKSETGENEPAASDRCGWVGRTRGGVDRRTFLAAGGVGTLAAVAGCLEDARELMDDGGNEPVTEAETTALELPFEDPLVDDRHVHERSDEDLIGFDSTNAEYFPRPSGAEQEADYIRLNRAGSDEKEPTAVVYHFAEPISELRAEAHFHFPSYSEITVAESTDGSEWTEIEPTRDVYNDKSESDEYGDSWENVEYRYESFSDGVTYLKFTLAGEAEYWCPQLGHVVVE